MKLKSVAGIVLTVKDINKSADFYESLGFLASKRESDYTSVRLNWFWIEFRQGESSNEDSGEYVYINVEGIDDYHKSFSEKKLNPTEVIETRGNKEFIIKDPDGYKLVFFEK